MRQKGTNTLQSLPCNFTDVWKIDNKEWLTNDEIWFVSNILFPLWFLLVGLFNNCFWMRSTAFEMVALWEIDTFTPCLRKWSIGFSLLEHFQVKTIQVFTESTTTAGFRWPNLCLHACRQKLYSWYIPWFLTALGGWYTIENFSRDQAHPCTLLICV